MTDGSPEAGDAKRDDEAHDASPAAPPAADPATLASTTEALAAQSGETEAEDTIGSAAGEGAEYDEDDDDDDSKDEEEEEEEEDEDEEPKLKYARLTPHLGAVYRNGDATSSFLVAGDKMIIGSHNGNIVSLNRADLCNLLPLLTCP